MDSSKTGAGRRRWTSKQRQRFLARFHESKVSDLRQSRRSLTNGTLAAGSSFACGTGDVTLNAGGELSIGAAGSQSLSVGGSFTQTGGTLLLTANSPVQGGSYNALNVTGTATLSGTLELDATNYTSGETFTFVLKASTITGNFASVVSADPSIVIVSQTLSANHQSLTVTVASLASFSQWESAYNITSPAAATPENDGVPNLLKYLYDINPTVPMSAFDRAALPASDINTTTKPGTQYLTLTYRQGPYLTGMTVNVQTSPDLQTWTTVNPPDLSQQVGTDSTTGDPIMEVGVKRTGATKQFIRLNVTSP